MIVLHRRNRIGNMLSQYSFARVLARRFGCRLLAAPVAGFGRTWVRIDGEEVFGPAVRWRGQWPFDGLVGRRVERQELFTAPCARLTLEGWFQRFEFIADCREVVREDWLRLDDPHPPRPAGDLAICLRLGDDPCRTSVKDDPQAEPPENRHPREDEVRLLVKRVAHERLFLVTDQPRHALIAGLRDLQAEIVCGRAMENFRFLHSCQKVAIGQDAGEWWAAFLGRAQEIYFPRIEQGAWSHPSSAKFVYEPEHYGIDLRVLDEDRWIYGWWK
jgi:hypothetical protein